MKIFKGNSIYTVYKHVVKYLLRQKPINNGTREIENAILEVKNPTFDNIQFYRRDISMKYVNAEMKWYWSADDSCETIGQHAKMWLKISDDGKTSNSAYGYIIHKKYGKDQLQEVINELKKDITSRKGVIIINDPTIDKLKTKDLQCTIGLQFLVRNGKLTETVYMRSNDIYFGLPYDYIYFISLGHYVARQLNVKFEKYVHCATSLHMYEKDYKGFSCPRKTSKVNLDVDNIIGECYD